MTTKFRFDGARMKRRTITAALERRIIMAQIRDGRVGQPIPGMGLMLICQLCPEPIWPDDPVIHEHMVPLCQGGADNEENIRLVHKQCADRKTNGGSKATSYGGDRHANDKVNRLTGKTGRKKWKRKIPAPADPWNTAGKEARK